MTPDVCKNLGLQPKLADSLAVCSGLFGGSGRGEFNVFNAKCVEGFRNCNFGLGVKEGIRKLFTLWLRVKRVQCQNE